MKSLDEIKTDIREYAESRKWWNFFQWGSAKHIQALQNLKDALHQIDDSENLSIDILQSTKQQIDQILKDISTYQKSKLHSILIEASNFIENKIIEKQNITPAVVVTDTPPAPIESQPVSEQSATVLIVTDRLYDGLGDCFFALKLANGIQDQIRHNEKPWKVIMTSRTTVNNTLRDIASTNGYNSNFIVDTDKLQEATIDSPITMIIGGPVELYPEIILDINTVLSNQHERPPWIFIPEYGYETGYYLVDRYIGGLKYTRFQGTVNYEFYGVLEAGFGKGCLGVFTDISKQDQVHLIEDRLQDKINEIIQTILINSQNVIEYSINYCNSAYEYKSMDFNCNQHFTLVHALYAKYNTNHQIVFMVGPDKEDKLLSLKHKRTLSALQSANFTHIVWHNADNVSNIEHIKLNNTPSLPRKEYHVIYTKGMTHESMLACYQMSGPIVGSMGDQSFIEALEHNKIVVYQMRAHKKSFIIGYDLRINEATNNDVLISEMLELLRSNIYMTNDNYERLGELINDCQVKFLNANKQVILQAGQLSKSVFDMLQTIKKARKRDSLKTAEEIYLAISPYSASFYKVTDPEIRELVANYDRAVKSGGDVAEEYKTIICKYNEHEIQKRFFWFKYRTNCYQYELFKYLSNIFITNPDLYVMDTTFITNLNIQLQLKHTAAINIRSIFNNIANTNRELKQVIEAECYAYMTKCDLCSEEGNMADSLSKIINQYKELCENNEHYQIGPKYKP